MLSMTRRRFVGGLGATGASLFFPNDGRTAEPLKVLGRIAYQLSWIKNFQFAGEYIADYRKYYQRFGLTVDLVAGGPSTIVDPIVVSGKVLVGQSSPAFMARALSKGAPIKCIGANYQKTLFSVVSLARKPILEPQDLLGKKIGVQTNNLVTWHAFLNLNKLDPARIEVVPVQFDMTPLISGEVDGFHGNMNDDVVHLRAKGYDARYMLVGDHGFRLFSATYSVLESSLSDKNKRAQLVAFMQGELLGWRDAIKDPALGAKLTVEVYGKDNGLDPEIQESSCQITKDFMVTPETKDHGLFWMSPQSVSETISTLAACGLPAPPDMFTNEILAEAYERNRSIQA